MTHAKTRSILLTGATGSVGTHLVNLLSGKNIFCKVFVRSPEQASRFIHLSNVEVAYGDLNDRTSIQAALKGIESAFLLTNSSEHAQQLQLNFLAEAQSAGVHHIVKLSQYAARADSPVRFLRYHAVVEKAIEESGIPYTFLRPNLYMQGLLAFTEYISKSGEFYASVGAAKISTIDVRDIASVAAQTLVHEKHRNKVYNLTGPEAITHYQMAAHLSNALSKPVQFIDVAPEQMAKGLRAAGFPEWQVGGLIEDYAHYARGEAEEISDAVERVTGMPARGFGSFAKDYASYFD